MVAALELYEITFTTMLCFHHDVYFTESSGLLRIRTGNKPVTMAILSELGTAPASDKQASFHNSDDSQLTANLSGVAVYSLYFIYYQIPW